MRYEAIERVGVGSYGSVYRGVDLSSGKVVAMKAVDLERVPEEIEVRAWFVLLLFVF